MNEMPFWEKYTLTIREAAEYFHIGEKRLRELVDEDDRADYLLWIGNRVLIKKRVFERFIDETNTI